MSGGNTALPIESSLCATIPSRSQDTQPRRNRNGRPSGQGPSFATGDRAAGCRHGGFRKRRPIAAMRVRQVHQHSRGNSVLGTRRAGAGNRSERQRNLDPRRGQPGRQRAPRSALLAQREELWRLVNAAADTYLRLHLADIDTSGAARSVPIEVVGLDGVPFADKMGRPQAQTSTESDHGAAGRAHRVQRQARCPCRAAPHRVADRGGGDGLRRRFDAGPRPGGRQDQYADPSAAPRRARIGSAANDTAGRR